MTTVYSNTFTGTNGAAPADFTPVEGTCDIQSSAARILTPATAFQRAKMYYAVPSCPQDFVATFDVVIQAGTTTDWYLEFAMRGNSNSFNNQWLFSSWQIQYNPSISGPQLYNVGATGTNTFIAAFSGTNSHPSPTVGDTLHVKVAPLGTTCRLKIWKNAQSEPGSYDTVTDTGAPAVGTRIMLGVVQGATASPALDTRWDSLLIDDGVVATGAAPRLVRV